jgi:hypothetical protein
MPLLRAFSSSVVAIRCASVYGTARKRSRTCANRLETDLPQPALSFALHQQIREFAGFQGAEFLTAPEDLRAGLRGAGDDL